MMGIATTPLTTAVQNSMADGIAVRCGERPTSERRRADLAQKPRKEQLLLLALAVTPH
jgi:hypothetical protein